MDYAEQQRRPSKHLIYLGIVAALHVVLGWALVNGLARKMVEVIKGPIETKIIEEIKPPPPPPENLPPPPKLLPPPPPSFVPPPEVQIANPPPAPSITVTRVAPPPTPVTIAPAPPPVAAPPAPAAPAAPAAPPAPKLLAVPPQLTVSNCEKPDYPAAANRAEVSGISKLRFTVDATGTVVKAEVERSAGNSREHRLLDRAAIDILSKCRFKPGLDEQGKPVGGVSSVDYVWKLPE